MKADVIKCKLEYIRFAGGLIAPGRFWVETLSLLKYIPNILTPWKKAVEEKGNEEAAFNISLVDLVRSDLQATSGDPGMEKKREHISFTESILEMQTKENNNLKLNGHALAALPGSFFTAGFDTTASTMSAGPYYASWSFEDGTS